MVESPTLWAQLKNTASSSHPPMQRSGHWNAAREKDLVEPIAPVAWGSMILGETWLAAKSLIFKWRVFIFKI